MHIVKGICAAGIQISSIQWYCLTYFCYRLKAILRGRSPILLQATALDFMKKSNITAGHLISIFAKKTPLIWGLEYPFTLGAHIRRFY